jgi:hypothetical protein
MSVQKVELDSLSAEVRSFLARAAEGRGVMVEDRQTQERYCILKFREPTQEEQRAALRRMTEMGAAVQTTLDQLNMSVEDAEREIHQAIAEVRREKAGK